MTVQDLIIAKFASLMIDGDQFDDRCLELHKAIVDDDEGKISVGAVEVASTLELWIKDFDQYVKALRKYRV